MKKNQVKKDTARVLGEEVFNKTVDIKLTDDEVRDRGRQLARAYTEKNELVEAFKKEQIKHKGKVNEFEVDIAKHTNSIETGTEPRTVKVYLRFHDPEMSKQSLYNYETRELIEVTDMNEPNEDKDTGTESKKEASQY